MSRYKPRTKNGYDLGAVVSAVQKAIRRGDEKVAGYFAIEMAESNFGAYLWRRLLIISAEDVYEGVTREIHGLKLAYDEVGGMKKTRNGVIFVAKAIIILCRALKSRDADHLVCCVYDRAIGIDPQEHLDMIEDSERIDVPEYAFCCHTKEGRARGKTKETFLKEEHEALFPKVDAQMRLFDDLVELV